jgi:hypothetical protein
MIHQWFMQFGAIEFALAVLGFIGARVCARRHPAKDSEDKGGQAVETLFFGGAAAVVLVVALFLVFFGVSATYVGWVGMALLGIALGLLESIGD